MSSGAIVTPLPDDRDRLRISVNTKNSSTSGESPGAANNEPEEAESEDAESSLFCWLLLSGHQLQVNPSGQIGESGIKELHFQARKLPFCERKFI